MVLACNRQSSAQGWGKRIWSSDRGAGIFECLECRHTRRTQQFQQYAISHLLEQSLYASPRR